MRSHSPGACFRKLKVNSIKIALLDAEPSSATGISKVLESSGVVSSRFASSARLFRELRRSVFDVVLVSDNLPDDPATDVVQALRRATTFQMPILVIAHNVSQVNLIDAFDAGADDYVVFTSDPSSLLPRIIGHHRRARRREGSGGRQLSAGDYTLDLDACCVRFRAETIRLTPKEFALAKLMFSSPAVTLPRDHIEIVVWGSTLPPLSRALAAMVARLRRVLRLRPEHGVTLRGVHSMGYRLDIAAPDSGI